MNKKLFVMLTLLAVFLMSGLISNGSAVAAQNAGVQLSDMVLLADEEPADEEPTDEEPTDEEPEEDPKGE
ncbi:MAG: hypothetical protein OEZ28_04365 [Nitrospinota bacterium]|nr:hypothetical protein [Nitrospinota bacterium]